MHPLENHTTTKPNKTNKTPPGTRRVWGRMINTMKQKYLNSQVHNDSKGIIYLWKMLMNQFISLTTLSYPTHILKGAKSL
jgi:hypothetical protein